MGCLFVWVQVQYVLGGVGGVVLVFGSLCVRTCVCMCVLELRLLRMCVIVSTFLWEGVVLVGCLY